MKADIFKTSLLAGAARLPGFLIPFVVAAAFGVSPETDAFFLAFSVILLIQMVVGNVFETAIVPFIADERARKGRLEAWVGGVMVWTTFFSAALTAATAIAAKPLFVLLASLTPAAQGLAVRLLFEMLPMIFLMTWSSTLNGALNACKAFSVPALSPAARSVVVITFILLWKGSLGIHAIPAGYVAGEALRLAVSGWAYGRAVGALAWRWELDHEARRFFQSAAWQTIALAVLCSLSLINQVMASYAGAGDLSLFAYGERLRNVPFMIFFTGVLPVVFSHWANERSGEAGAAWPGHRRAILRFGALAFAAALAMVALADSLTTLAYGRGAFPREALDRTSAVFAWLIGGFVFDVVGLLCVRFLILHRRDKIYMALAIGRVFATAALNALLLPDFGIHGIAASVTLVNGIYAAALWACAARFGGSRLSSERSGPCCSVD